MALTCFFGSAVSPGNKSPVPVAPECVLVVTNASVAAESTYTGRMTLVVTTRTQAAPITLGTVHPELGQFTLSLQQFFSAEDAPCFDVVVDKKALADPENHGVALADEARVPCRLHVTGYFERDDESDVDVNLSGLGPLGDEIADDEGDEEEEEEEDDEDDVDSGSFDDDE